MSYFKVYSVLFSCFFQGEVLFISASFFLCCYSVFYCLKYIGSYLFFRNIRVSRLLSLISLDNPIKKRFLLLFCFQCSHFLTRLSILVFSQSYRAYSPVQTSTPFPRSSSTTMFSSLCSVIFLFSTILMFGGCSSLEDMRS